MSSGMPAHIRIVSNWLFVMAGLVAMMVFIGGVTRLTGSGLSMVEWRPLMGTLPPLSEAEWLRVFTLYQTSPEFSKVNSDMELAGFKMIFFWEYVHRLWGRLLGLAFVLPLLYFFMRRMIPAGYGLKLIGLMVLGGMQGGIGWWMVASGLVDNPAVSQYRLTIHLSMALLIFLLLLWTGLNLRFGKASLPTAHGAASFVMLVITIIAGAFVAGLDAGLVYNEYPLMGEGFVPVEYGELGLTDAFENPASAQFHHRWLAFFTVIAIASLWWRAAKANIGLSAHLMLVMLGVQFALGLTTLLLYVPVWAGALHQLGAVLLLGTIANLLHKMNRGTA